MSEEMINRPNRLVFVRHAESRRNEAKKGSVYFADDAARRVIRGIPDHETPLTDKGHWQARQTGRTLHEKFGHFDYVYHSGYARTVQTAEAILEAYSPAERALMKVRLDLFIRERDPGHAYDMTETEVLKKYPDLAEYWRTFGGFFARPPGGESLADVTNRTYTFLNKLFRDRAGQNIMIVTHGGTLKCFRFLLEHWDYERALKWPPGEGPHNCGVTTYEFNRELGRLELKNYNEVLFRGEDYTAEQA